MKEWGIVAVISSFLGSLFVAFRIGRYIGSIENKMQLERQYCRPPAWEYEECQPQPPTIKLSGYGEYQMVGVTYPKVTLVLYKGKVSEVLCDYLNYEDKTCTWCKVKPMRCKYFVEKPSLFRRLTKLLIG